MEKSYLIEIKAEKSGNITEKLGFQKNITQYRDFIEISPKLAIKDQKMVDQLSVEDIVSTTADN